jgi:hypothetical protein
MHRPSELGSAASSAPSSTPPSAAAHSGVAGRPAGTRPSTAGGRAQWRDPGPERPAELPNSEMRARRRRRRLDPIEDNSATHTV